MAVDIVTKEDLQLFRMQLLNDIRELFAPRENGVQKQWLKNSDVRQLLKISSNTVQRLRIAGKLKSSKVGGVHYYRYEDVQQLLESGLKIAS